MATAPPVMPQSIHDDGGRHAHGATMGKARSADGQHLLDYFFIKTQKSHPHRHFAAAGEKIDQQPQAGYGYGNQRGNGRTANAHPQSKDKQRVQTDVDHRSDEHGVHGHICVAFGANGIADGLGKNNDGAGDENDFKIVDGQGHGCPV